MVVQRNRLLRNKLREDVDLFQTTDGTYDWTSSDIKL